MKSILFLVPARLGDAIMTTPALNLLSQYEPNAKIDILAVSGLGASVYHNNPHIQDIHIQDSVDDMETLGKQYDFCVVTHIDHKTLALAEALSIDVKRAEGADSKQAQAPQQLRALHRLYDNKVGYEDIPYQMFPTQQDIEFVQSLIKKRLKKFENFSLIGCHLGCHGIAKKNKIRHLFKKKSHPKVWPLKHFVKLEKILQATHPDIRFVITGGPSEENLAHEFMNLSKNAINLCGKTNTSQLAALMTCLDAYVSSDTGAMHVACAMDVPLVALFGPTNATRTGPYPASEKRVIIHADTMKAIKPEIVAEKLTQLIKTSS